MNLSSFTFSVNQEIALGDIDFELSITAGGVNDYTYLNTILFQIPVTMDQSGFPFNTNFSVKSSPLAVDFDNDGEIEIIFGDNNGLVHVLSSDGTEWDNGLFPFDAGDEIWGSLAYADIDLDATVEGDGANYVVIEFNASATSIRSSSFAAFKYSVFSSCINRNRNSIFLSEVLAMGDSEISIPNAL